MVEMDLSANDNAKWLKRSKLMKVLLLQSLCNGYDDTRRSPLEEWVGLTIVATVTMMGHSDRMRYEKFRKSE